MKPRLESSTSWKRMACAALLSAVAAGCGGPEADVEAAAPAEAGAVSQASSSSGDGGLRTLSLSSASVSGGGVVTGTVTLAGEARGASGGVYVYVSFPRTLLAGPRFVRVPNGQRSATFTLFANPFVTAAASATVTANTSNPQPFVSARQALSVVPAAAPPAGPAPQVASVSLDAASARSGATVGAVVTLTAPAPAGGAAVQVGIGNDATNLDADVPPVVVVPAGQTSAAFPVRTHLTSGAAVDETVVANYFGGAFGGAVLTVTP